MKKIKEAYYYIFYRFYLFAETPPFVEDNSDWKAAGFVSLLEVFIYFSVGIFYTFYFNKSYVIADDSLLYLVPMGVIILVNYWAFLYDDTWKDYFEEFENWPPEKNRRAGIIVLCVILSIILCFSFSIYLTTQMDLYRKNHISILY